MEHEGPQTKLQSLSVIISPRRSLRFSWTFSITGLFQFATCNGSVRLIFFPSVLRKKIPTEEWCKLLVISSRLGCKEVRARAIDELTARKSKVSSIDRIELGTKYDVSQWLPEAYADAFTRESHLTTEEGERLGLEKTVRVLEGRDKCKRNGWSNSSDNNVARLVKDILLPLNRQVAPLPKFSGRFVYRVSRTSLNFSTSDGTTLIFSSLRGWRMEETRHGGFHFNRLFSREHGFNTLMLLAFWR